MIELRHLRYLVAVAEEGHVTRAAARLGIQQPPLTRQIHDLEAAVGTPLFDRTPRGVRLTEAGEAVVEAARAILDQAAGLPDLAGRAARGERGRIAIGYTSSAAFHPFVVREIRAFGQASPQVRLALEEESTAELVRDLANGRLDAAFLRAPPGEAADLRIDPLLEEPMAAALPPGHPLAARTQGIALEDLAGETFVLYRRLAGPGLYDAIIAACHAAGFSPTVGQEAPRMPSTLSLVAAGLGVSLTPASMRRLNVDGVTLVPLNRAHGLTAPLMLATRRQRSAATERFREAMCTAARLEA